MSNGSNSEFLNLMNQSLNRKPQNFLIEEEDDNEKEEEQIKYQGVNGEFLRLMDQSLSNMKTPPLELTKTEPPKIEPLIFDEEEVQEAGIGQFAIDKAAAFGSGVLGIVKGLSEVAETIPDAAVQSYMNVSDFFTDNDYTEEDRKKASDFIETSFTLDQYIEDFQKVTDSYRTKYDKGMIDSLGEGDVLAFTDQLIGGVLAAAPSLIVSLLPGGVIALGASETGNTYEELSEASPEDRGGIMLLNSVLQGAVEATSERIMKGSYKKISGLLGAEKAAKGLIKQIGKSALFEGGSEALAEETNNALDGFYTDNKFTNSKGEFDVYNVTKRFTETFLIGAVLGGGKTALDGSENIKRVYNETLTPDNIKEENLKLSEEETKLRAINKKAQNEDVSKKISKVQDKLKENKKIVSEVLNTYTEEEIVEQINLKSEITETEAQIKNQDLNQVATEELKSQVEQKKKVLADFYNTKKDQLVEERAEKSVSFSKTIDQDLELSDSSKSNVEILEDQQAFDTIADKVKSKEVRENAKKSFSSDGVFVLNDKIYINRETANEKEQITTKNYPVFQQILNTVAKTTNEKARLVENLKSNLGENNTRLVDEKIQKDFSKFVDEKNVPRSMTQSEFNNFKQTEKYLDEFIPTLSNLIESNSVKFNKGTFTKIGDFLHSVFRPIGFNKAQFKNEKNVYDFIKSYQENTSQDEVSKKLRDIKAKESISQKDINSYNKLINQSNNVKIQEREINDLLGDVTKDQWDAGKGDQITKKVYSKLGTLIKSKIPNTVLRDSKFSEETFTQETVRKLIPHIKKFNPEKNQTLSDWINSELNNEILKTYTKPKQITKTKEEGDELDRLFRSISEGLAELDTERFGQPLDRNISKEDYIESGVQIRMDKETIDLLRGEGGDEIIEEVVKYAKEVAKSEDPDKKFKSLKRTKKYSKISNDFMEILFENNAFKSNRLKGHVEEVRVFNLMASVSESKGLGFQLLKKGTAGYKNKLPDIQFNFTPKTIKSDGKELKPIKEKYEGVRLEVKSSLNDDMGTPEVRINKDGEISSEGIENNDLLLSALESFNFNDRVEYMWNFFNTKVKGLKVPRTLGSLKDESGKRIQSKVQIPLSAYEAYLKDIKNKPDLKIDITTKGSKFSIDNITEFYNKKGIYHIQIKDAGAFFLGKEKDQDKNIFNLPYLNDPKYGINAEVRFRIEKSSADSAEITKLKKKFPKLSKNLEKLKEKIPYKDKKVTFRVRAALKLTGDKKNTESTADFTKPETLVEGFNNNDENFLESSDSQGLSDDFNKILEESQGVEATKRYSRRAATREGAKKGRYEFFVPPSGDNFMGLMYSFLGKGKVGDGHKKFFESKLMGPYKRGISSMDSQRQKITVEYKDIKKKNFKYIDQLKLETKLTGEHVPNTNFNKDAAVRVYLWNKQGISNSDLDLTQKEVNTLVEFVEGDAELLAFANDLGAMKTLGGKYPEPQEFWEASTIVSDLSYSVDNVRSEYLNQFIENSNEVFSEENLNKIQATYGPKFREALEGSLNSMKTGVLRKPLKKGSIEQKWFDWINNSSATLMFFNVRSAILQTISSVNYLNWSDNNPVQAAKAFANTKQFWKDFEFLFNSDKLKQRRAGTKINIAEAEISAAVQGQDGVNQTKSVIKTLLNKGFYFTQIADSFAIAMGGASMYRNRINSNIKKGMTPKEAEKAAFEDFDQITEETQQSSDPAEISQQQRSHLGRILLAFANTPMQYARLTKKAFLDLKNNRGDRKTNLSKLAYYAAIQNILFTGMQTALFATLGFGGNDEDDEKQQKLLGRQVDFAVNGVIDSFLRGGFGYVGAATAAIKNAAIELYKQQTSDSIFAKDVAKIENDLLSVSPPIGSKFGKGYSAYKQSQIEKDVINAKGFSYDSPIYQIGAKILSAGPNIPLDRAYQTIKNISDSFNQEYETWQRVLLALGWSSWDLGLENHEHELIKTTAKDARRKAGYKKAAETRRKNREAEMKKRGGKPDLSKLKPKLREKPKLN